MIVQARFRRLSRAAMSRAAPQAVYARHVADLETPVSAYLKLGEGRTTPSCWKACRAGKRAGAIPSSG